MPKGNRAIVKAANKHSIFIDSSAWIALFSRRDQHHEDADRKFRAIISAKQPMVTSNLVLAEIHRLFLHRAGIKAAAASLAEEPADLVVMGMRGHSALQYLILGRTAEQVMRSAQIPVLLAS